MGILVLASGQALPGSGPPFCHQEEGSRHSYLPKVDEVVIGVQEIWAGVSQPQQRSQATEAQTLYGQLIKYGDLVSEPRLPIM